MSGYPSDLFQDIPSDDLTCGICLEVLNNPHQCTKGHLFCLKCIQLALKYRSRCPLCTNPLTMHLLQRNSETAEKILDLNVKCSTDCQWTGPLKTRKTHIICDCEAEMVPCYRALTNDCVAGCLGQIKREEYSSHLMSLVKELHLNNRFGTVTIKFDHYVGVFQDTVSILFDDGVELKCTQPPRKVNGGSFLDSYFVLFGTTCAVGNPSATATKIDILKNGRAFRSKAPVYNHDSGHMTLEMFRYFMKCPFRFRPIGCMSSRNFVIAHDTEADKAVFVLMPNSVHNLSIMYDSAIFTQQEVAKLVMAIVQEVGDLTPKQVLGRGLVIAVVVTLCVSLICAVVVLLFILMQKRGV